MHHQKKEIQSEITYSSTVTPTASQPDQSKIQQLFDKCSSSKEVPILFSIEDEPYCKSFLQSSAHLPLGFQSLFDPVFM